MTIHKVEGKVYVEFPVAMLGREMLFASSIEIRVTVVKELPDS